MAKGTCSRPKSSSSRRPCRAHLKYPAVRHRRGGTVCCLPPRFQRPARPPMPCFFSAPFRPPVYGARDSRQLPPMAMREACKPANEVEAHALSAELEAAHIPHQLRPHHDTAYPGMFDRGRGWGAIAVDEADLAAAQALIAQFRADQEELVADAEEGQ